MYSSTSSTAVFYNSSFLQQKFFTTAVYTQVGTLVPVEPLDDAYTGPLFTLWEGLYRRFTNPVGALLAILPVCR